MKKVKLAVGEVKTPSRSVVPPQNGGSDLFMEKKINELSEKIINNVNEINNLNNKVGEVVRKIDDLQKDISTIYQDRDTLAIIQNKITENTNSINNVSVANTKATTELKGEIRCLSEAEETKMEGLSERIKSLEQGQKLVDSKYQFIKKLFGKYYLVKIK